MTHHYVILAVDDDHNLVVKPTQRTAALDLLTEQQILPTWAIKGQDYTVTVYGGVLETVPTGENREEIDNLILIALGLREQNANLELQLVLTQSPDVEEFRDSVGINVVIPATEIAICGIFVWGSGQADLKIYETSLLRVNAGLYIEVLQIAVEIANHLAGKRVQTLPQIRSALNEFAQTFDTARLSVR